MSEAQKGIPKGVIVNLGSAGLTYTTSEGDQIISIKKSDYDALSAENTALKQKLTLAGFHKADKETHINESAQFVKEATEKIAELSESLKEQCHINAIGAERELKLSERLKEAWSLIYVVDLLSLAEGYPLEGKIKEYLSKTTKKDIT